MYKTYLENTKDNIHYSSSPKLNTTTVFPMIFNNFETEKKFVRDLSCLDLGQNKIFLPLYKNINEEMVKIRRKIRSLFNIKNTVFKEMITKKNSLTYQNFIHGFARYFFGPKGIVTRKYKILREYYYKNYDLTDKIFTGKLEYYEDNFHKWNKFNQRQNDAKKKILSLSKNYAVVDRDHDLYSVKAITSKRLINKKKNFVVLNKQRYSNILTEISEKEERFNKNNYLNLLNSNYKSKNNIFNKKKVKIKMNIPIKLKNYKKFYNIINKNNIYGNYKKSINDIKNKYQNRKINRNISPPKTNSCADTELKRNKVNNSNNSNLFLTQCLSTNNIRDKKINSLSNYNFFLTSSNKKNESKYKNNNNKRINNSEKTKLGLNKIKNRVILRNLSFNHNFKN